MTASLSDPFPGPWCAPVNLVEDPIEWNLPGASLRNGKLPVAWVCRQIRASGNSLPASENDLGIVNVA